MVQSQYASTSWTYAIVKSPSELVVLVIVLLSILLTLLFVHFLGPILKVELLAEEKGGTTASDLITSSYATFCLGIYLILSAMLSRAFDSYSEGLNDSAQSISGFRNLLGTARATGDQAFYRELKAKVVTYIRSVVDHEWKELERTGNTDEETQQAFKEVGTFVRGAPPSSVFSSALLSEMDEITAARDRRLARSAPRITNIFALFLLLTSILTVYYLMMFISFSKRVQFVCVFLNFLAVLMVLYVTLDLDYLYVGSMALTPQPYKNFLLQLRQNEE